MPLIAKSTYQASGLFRNPHINTLYSALVRKVESPAYTRQRWELPDGDFLDIDISSVGAKKLAIVLHGLEGSSDRPYVRGMIRYFNEQGWDGLGVNFRSCSGEPNRLLRLYHIGETNDLQWVIEKMIAAEHYEEIVLIGFSLGGNVILKYLGEQADAVLPQVVSAVVFSVPCEVSSANAKIDQWFNAMYRWRFMQTLNKKMKHKATLWPEKVPDVYPLARNFTQFDNRFTAPLHGFKNAEDYWQKNSSIHYLPHIRIPTLLVNAEDDTFLSRKCFPKSLAKDHPFFYLETPSYGGHVGFVTKRKDDVFWTERRALEFVQKWTACAKKL